MKVILSRKGFDSKNGGMPSVIMPNGDMVSMPIPALHGQSYASLHYKGKRYSKLLKELRPAFRERNCHAERGESKAVWFDHGVLRPDSIIEKYAYKETRHTVFYRGIWQEMCLKESYEAVDFAKRMLSPRNFQDGKYDELVDQIEEIERQYAEGEIDRDEFVSNLQVVDDDSQDLIEDGDLSSEGFHDFQMYLGEILDRQGVEYAESGIVTP